MMKRIKTYKMFESADSGLTQKQEEFLNECTRGSWKYDPSTGLVNVEGDFDCSKKKLDDLKGIKFGKVSGNFDCYRNNLTSLEGAPLKVGENFDCFKNKLTSLKGSPQEVGGDFVCSFNPLSSLEGAPRKVGMSFDCGVFGLPSGEWNLKGWLKVLNVESDEAKALILTLLTPEELNKGIEKDAGGMLMKLRSVWNEPIFQDIKKQLQFPAQYGDVDKTMKSLDKFDAMKDLI